MRARVLHCSAAPKPVMSSSGSHEEAAAALDALAWIDDDEAAALSDLLFGGQTAYPRGNMRCTHKRRRNGCKASTTVGLSNAAYTVGRARSGVPFGRQAACRRQRGTRRAPHSARRYESGTSPLAPKPPASPC